MKKILFLFVAALCFGSWATAGDLTFEKVGDFAWVNKGAIVAIDINGDGYQSVLYMERADDKRSVYLANNKGTLTKYEYGKEEGLKDLGIAFHENPGMVVMDVNKDGKQDVVVAGGWPPAVNVYLNNGEGGFTKDDKQTNLIGARDYDNSDYLAAGDYDNDGWEDLFVLGLTNEDKALQLSIYRNNNGVFELAQSLEGCRGGSIAVGDVNGDGNLDVFYNGYGNGYVTNLYYGDGKGTWTKAEGIDFVKSNKGDVAIIDFNGDGKMDLLEQSREVQNTTIYCNNGDGTFTKKSNEETGLPVRDDLFISYGDFNVDGKMDIIASHWSIGSNDKGTALFLNNGDFTFTKVDLENEARGEGVFAWDYDNDKKCDYMVWNYSDSKRDWNAPIVRNTTVIEEPKPETYTVTILVNPEGAGTVTGAGEYEDGAEVTVTAEENEGYIFVGWMEDGEFVAEDYEYTFTILNDVDLVAVYATQLLGVAEDLVITETALTATAILSTGTTLTVNLVLGEYDEEEEGYWLAETTTLTLGDKELTLFAGLVMVDAEQQMAIAVVLAENEGVFYAFTLILQAPASGVDNINTNVAPRKVIRDGQLIIIKNGVEYNVQGAQL